MDFFVGLFTLLLWEELSFRWWCPLLLPQRYYITCTVALFRFCMERVWERARELCYWPSMLKDICRWCEQCVSILSCGGEWDNYLKHVASAYNTSVHVCTGFTPYYLTHGRQAWAPVNVVAYPC